MCGLEATAGNVNPHKYKYPVKSTDQSGRKENMRVWESQQPKMKDLREKLILNSSKSVEWFSVYIFKVVAVLLLKLD